jgi:hypothetical protein
MHLTHLMEEGPSAFVQFYWMEYVSFVKLCGLIEPHVSIDPKMFKVWTSGKSSQKIVEIILHCRLLR